MFNWSMNMRHYALKKILTHNVYRYGLAVCLWWWPWLTRVLRTQPQQKVPFLVWIRQFILGSSSLWIRDNFYEKKVNR